LAGYVQNGASLAIFTQGGAAKSRRAADGPDVPRAGID